MDLETLDVTMLTWCGMQEPKNARKGDEAEHIRHSDRLFEWWARV